MQDSTLATEQMASLNAKYAELQSKLPMDAMMALQTYQNARFKNIAAGTAPAATAAKLAASQQSPFSLASKGAVSSVGS
jgi:3-hydroxymyristoyl/3-hydroxydecanoyl-(acyl carrier protein) dehydratase